MLSKFLMRGSLLGKLRNKLLLINLISLSVIITLILTATFLNTYNRNQQELESRMKAIPSGVMENAMLAEQDSKRVYIDPEEINDSLIISGEMNLPVDYSKSFVINVNPDGNLSVFSQIGLEGEDYIKAARTALNRGERKGTITISDRRWAYRLESVTGKTMDDSISIIKFIDVDDSSRTLTGLLISMIISGIAAIVTILIVSFLVANRAIRPIEESMEKQRRFVADASHELKTPLAIIDANAEAAKNCEDPDKWIGRIEEESVRMNKLIENLLYLARTEDASPEKMPFDLTQMVEGEIGRVEAVLFEKGIDLKFEHDPNDTIVVNSDREKIQQAVLILLDNAVKYTAAGGHVDVNIYEKEKCGIVAISNTGEYIHTEERHKLFDRFYRMDKSRSNTPGSYGLGLSIAKTIADRLGAGLTATSARIVGQSGLALNTFVLKIPQ